jgi:hypothetical protein
MSSPLSKKYPDLGYLRLKTTGLGPSHDITISQDGLLTPISAHCDNRRPSITSSGWSVLSGESSRRSQSSSVGSVSQEPSTPPSHAAGKEGLLLGLNMNHQLSNHGKERYLESLYQSSVTSPTGLEMTPSRNWPHSRDETQLALRQTQLGFTNMMVEANNNPFASGHKPESVTPVSFPDYSRPWTGCSFVPTMASSNTFRSSFSDNMPVHSLASNIPSEDPWMVVNSNAGVDVATIMPRQTMVDVPPTLSDDPIREMNLSSPGEPSMWDTASFQDCKPEPEHSGFDMHGVGFLDHSPCSPYSPMSLSHSHRPKKQLKYSSSKKKAKLVSYSIGVDHRLRDKAEALNRIVPVEVSQSSKKHKCDVCPSKFQRVEHLRRHIMIHRPVEESPNNICPDPDCRKNFGSRADNMGAHFRTHLTLSTTRRNPFRTFEEFYGYIQNDKEIPQEAAERYIGKLEEWRRKGGHLKSEKEKSESGGRSRGQ